MEQRCRERRYGEFSAEVGARERRARGRADVRVGCGRPLEVLKWARRETRAWDERVVQRRRRRSGHLDVLKWARENDCPWDWRTCTYAAEGGHLEVLKWARANGRPWDEETCTGPRRRAATSRC